MKAEQRVYWPPPVSRDRRWATLPARWLMRMLVTPNQCSIFANAGSGARARALTARSGPARLFICAVAIQLRLLPTSIRLLGRLLGLPQDFRGRMAKQYRMAALTIEYQVPSIYVSHQTATRRT